MDPDACLDRLLDAAVNRDPDRLVDAAADLVRARHAAAVGAALPGRAARLAAQAAQLLHAATAAGTPPPADVCQAADRLAVWAAQLAGERAWAAFATLNPATPGAQARRTAARRRRLVAAEQTASLGRRAAAALVVENHPDRHRALRAVAGQARLAKQRRYARVRQAGPPAWQTPTPTGRVGTARAAEDGWWWTRAACAGLAPELFTAATTRAQVRWAKQVCARCPVQPDCLAEALAVPVPAAKQYDAGVIAGTTPVERARLRAIGTREQPGGRGAA